MDELRVPHSLTPAMTAMPAAASAGMAGKLLAALASVLLHASVIGGIAFAVQQHHDLAGSSAVINAEPVFVTLVQEPAIVPQTPELMRPDSPEEVRPAQTQKAELKDQVSAAPKDEPVKKQAQEKSLPQNTARAARPASAAKNENLQYAGGAGNAQVRYQDKVRAAIESHRIYPRAARRLKMEGTTVIHISIARDGRILDTQLIKSSDHYVLDDAALEMIRAANPLPPIPASIARTPVSIRIPIGFALK